MSPPEADPHVALYNTLPLIDEAHAILRRELKVDPSVSNDNLVLPILQDPAVRALFRDGVPAENDGGSYAIWIVHRHFPLENGERMVSTGNTSKPVAKQSTHTTERWDASGNEIEFIQLDKDAVPSRRVPSASFVKAFHDLMLNKFGVSVLGLCLPTDELPPGYVLLEKTDPATRSQIVQLVAAVRNIDPNCMVYPSSWSVVGPNDGGATGSCRSTGQCEQCSAPPKPPRAPTQDVRVLTKSDF